MIYLYAILIVSLIIFVHEFGHLIAARLVSIPVKAFSIGFGPRLAGFGWGGVDYRLSLIPLGGYIEPLIATEDELFAIPLWRRVIFTLAGVAANIVFAIVALCAYRMLVQDMSFLSALMKATEKSVSLMGLIVASIPSLFTSGGEMTGLIGIVSQGGALIGSHTLHVLNFAALLSLNLAVINLLPLPVFDGGKVMFYLIEKIVPPVRKVSGVMSIAGWIIILGLTVYATSNDIARLII
jgi:regulator of sigma E protease